MAWTRRLTSFDRICLILLGTVAGIGLLHEALFQKVPEASELVQISGPLAGYSGYKSGRRRATVVLTIDGAPHRYWTDAVSDKDAPDVFRGVARVSLYSDKKPAYRPIDGNAYKSYGLYVDGRAVESLETALKREAFFLHGLFPLIGAGCLGMAFFVGRGWRRGFKPQLQRRGLVRIRGR